MPYTPDIDPLDDIDPRDRYDFPPEPDTPPKMPDRRGWWLWDVNGWVGPYPSSGHAVDAAYTEDPLGYKMDEDTICLVYVQAPAGTV